MMTQLLAWIFRDIKSYLRSSFALSLLVVVNAICGYILLTTLYYLKNSLAISFWLNNVALVFLIICPILVMKLFTESRALKELWRTMPISPLTIISGKYIGMCALLAGIVASMMPLVVTIGWWTNIQWGGLITGVLGVLVLGWTFIAIGTVIGSVVDSQRTIGLITFIAGVFFWLLDGLSTLFPEPIHLGLASFSLATPVLELIAGKISSIHVGFSLGAILLCIWISVQCWEYRYKGLRKRALKRTVLGCVVMAVWMIGLYQVPVTIDVKHHIQPLSTQTRNILSHMQFPVVVTVFHDNNADTEMLSRVLDQYPKLNAHITVQYIVRPLNIPEPIIVIEGNAKRIQFPLSRLIMLIPENAQQLFMGESVISGALQSLFRPVKSIGWITGHGEVDLKESAEKGGSYLAQAIANEPYELIEVDLKHPKETDLLVIASPMTRLAKEEISAIMSLNTRIPLVILTDPEGPDLKELLRNYGVQQSHSRIQDSPQVDISDQGISVPTILTHPITLSLPDNRPIVLSGTEALLVSPNRPIEPLLMTSTLSWAQVSTRDIQGPFNVGIYIPETRQHKPVVIISDRDWIQNAHIYTQSNRELILNCMAYLTNNGTGIRPEISELHQIYMTKKQWAILLLWLVGIPLVSTTFWWIKRQK